ncbi:MAG: Ig-like domain-containing protein [Panacagrimonas sp.]
MAGFNLTRDSGSAKEDPVDVVVAPSGKIYVLNRVGDFTDFTYLLQRFNADGAVDTSFSGDGKIEFTAASNLFADAEAFFALAVDETNQRALIGGTQVAGFGGDPQFVVKRLNFSGSFDGAFGSGGRAFVGTPAQGVVTRMTLDGTGRILLAGVDGTLNLTQQTFSGSKPFIARLTANGQVDASFAQTTILWGGTNDGPAGIFVQADGNILVSGAANLNSKLEFGGLSGFARLLPNGGGDASFTGGAGGNGAFTTDFEPGICVDNNKVGCEGAGLYRPLAGGKFLMAVYIDRTGDAGTSDTIQITRFNADGSLDTSFDNDGFQRFDSRFFLQGMVPALAPDDTVVGARDVPGKDLQLVRIKGYTEFVGSANTAPKAKADSFTVKEDSKRTDLKVVRNDTDADGDTLTVTTLTKPTKGGTVVLAAGSKSVLYTPKANFVGTETFKYSISDGKGGTSQATVTMKVNNVNDAPDARNDSFTVPKNAAFRTLAVLTNDRDPDAGTTLSITRRVGAQPANGTVRIQNGQIQYKPNAGFVGTNTFRYEISDGALTDTAVVTVRVQ